MAQNFWIDSEIQKSGKLYDPELVGKKMLEALGMDLPIDRLTREHESALLSD